MSLCHLKNWCPDYIWVKLLGFPTHLWSENIFREIGEKLGGFNEMDEETRGRKHMRWARICIQYSGIKLPANVELIVDDLAFIVPVLVDSNTWVEKIDRKIDQKIVDDRLTTIGRVIIAEREIAGFQWGLIINV